MIQEANGRFKWRSDVIFLKNGSHVMLRIGWMELMV